MTQSELVLEPSADPVPAPPLTARVALAALSAGAGSVHLAMAPAHADSDVLALGFALAGWFQLGWAVAIVARPGMATRLAGIAGNLAILSAWALSRTAGLPIGPHQGEAEAIELIDGVTVAFQVGIVAGAALLRPARRPETTTTLAWAGLPLVAVTALTAVAITAPNQHADLGGHDHDDTDEVSEVATIDTVALNDVVLGATAAALVDTNRCDAGLNHASYERDAQVAGVETRFGTGGHDHATVDHDHATVDHDPATVDHSAHTPAEHAAYEAAGSDDGHDHSDSTGTDTTSTGAGASQLADVLGALDQLAATGTTGSSTAIPGIDDDTAARLAEFAASEGELGAAGLVVLLSELEDDQYDAWLGSLHAERDTAAPDDNGGHGGHMGPQPWTALLDPAQCAELEAELATAQQVALDHPTAADAITGGWVMVTPYVPGIAAHYMNFAYVDGSFEVDRPEMILYDGNGPDAHVVGLSYYIIHPGDEEPLEGFTGDNDHYHRHVGLCVRGGLVVGDTTTTEEECAELGGVKQNGGAGWMSHAWVVPGCESPWGVFSAASPILDEALGSNSGQGEPCSGSSVLDRFGMDATRGDGDDTPLGGTGEQASD